MQNEHRFALRQPPPNWYSDGTVTVLWLKPPDCSVALPPQSSAGSSLPPVGEGCSCQNAFCVWGRISQFKIPLVRNKNRTAAMYDIKNLAKLKRLDEKNPETM